MNCHTFSTGLSSGHLGGSGIRVTLGGTTSSAEPCHPALIEQDDGVCSRSNVEGDFLQVHAHRLTVAPGHDDAGGLAFSGADRPKDPGRGAALISRSGRTGAALGPAPGEPGLLADACFVLPPQLYGRPFCKALADLRQTGGELFLKTAMSSGRCPLWQGRAESLR